MIIHGHRHEQWLAEQRYKVSTFTKRRSNRVRENTTQGECSQSPEEHQWLQPLSAIKTPAIDLPTVVVVEYFISALGTGCIAVSLNRLETALLDVVFAIVLPMNILWTTYVDHVLRYLSYQ